MPFILGLHPPYPTSPTYPKPCYPSPHPTPDRTPRPPKNHFFFNIHKNFTSPFTSTLTLPPPDPTPPPPKKKKNIFFLNFHKSFTSRFTSILTPPFYSWLTSSLPHITHLPQTLLPLSPTPTPDRTPSPTKNHFFLIFTKTSLLHSHPLDPTHPKKKKYIYIYIYFFIEFLQKLHFSVHIHPDPPHTFILGLHPLYPTSPTYPKPCYPSPLPHPLIRPLPRPTPHPPHLFWNFHKSFTSPFTSILTPPLQKKK